MPKFSHASTAALQEDIFRELNLAGFGPHAARELAEAICEEMRARARSAIELVLGAHEATQRLIGSGR